MSLSVRALTVGLPSLPIARRTLVTLASFLSGQTVTQVVNLVSGLLIVHWLSVGEYALYTLANVLLSIGAVGSDLGVSQGFIMFGARAKDDPIELGHWFGAARRYKRTLYVPVTIAIVALAAVTMRGHEWSPLEPATCVVLVLASVWVQQVLVLRQGVLNVRGDAGGLVQSGLGSALSRLALVVTLCREWPNAVMALVVTLASLWIGDYLLLMRSRRHVTETRAAGAAFSTPLREFVRPLIPTAIYTTLEGHVSTMLVSTFGHASSVAQVGALGRLGQIVGLLLSINPFWVQPHFARIERKGEFSRKAAWLLGGLAVAGGLLVGTGIILPGYWLWLLGPQYRGLQGVVALALATAWFVAMRAVAHTLLMSRGWTRDQAWNIPVSVSIQVAVLATLGVRTTEDALGLSIALAAGGLLLQCALLGRWLRSWE